MKNKKPVGETKKQKQKGKSLTTMSCVTSAKLLNINYILKIIIYY